MSLLREMKRSRSASDVEKEENERIWKMHIVEMNELISSFKNQHESKQQSSPRAKKWEYSAPDIPAHTDSLHITNLPDGILVGIASYLAKPSVALFAIAMTIDSQQTQTSKAIISSTNNWNVLDFSDIEKCLAAKLSDGDINKILRCIDAVNNVKILKLAGCVNITGSGLDLLRSSRSIQQIDLSLVGKHESPVLEPEPKISEHLVFPILDNIISGESSLKQLEFPKKWRNAQSTEMNRFLLRYNNYLRNQGYCCSKCDRPCVETGNEEWVDLDGGDLYGTQN